MQRRNAPIHGAFLFSEFTHTCRSYNSTGLEPVQLLAGLTHDLRCGLCLYIASAQRRGFPLIRLSQLDHQIFLELAADGKILRLHVRKPLIQNAAVETLIGVVVVTQRTHDTGLRANRGSSGWLLDRVICIYRRTEDH